MQLTNNFTLEELTKSETALRQNIDNTPTEDIVTNLRTLAEKCCNRCVNITAKA